MQAALLSSRPGSLPNNANQKLSDAERLAVLDDPAEWCLFSQPHDGESSAAAGLWESQVMVQGMHCAACALALERSLLGLAGVVATQVSAASGRASVVWSAALTRPSVWLTGPLALGYVLTPASSAQSPAHDLQQSRLVLWRWLVAGFCMMQVMMYAVPGYLAAPGDITPDIEQLLRWASMLLSLPVVLFSCTPFFSNALRDLRKRSISMDLPVALGIIITFAVSSAATFAPQGWFSLHGLHFYSLNS